MENQKKHTEMARPELRKHLMNLLDEAHEIVLFHNVCGGMNGTVAKQIGDAWAEVRVLDAIMNFNHEEAEK